MACSSIRPVLRVSSSCLFRFQSTLVHTGNKPSRHSNSFPEGGSTFWFIATLQKQEATTVVIHRDPVALAQLRVCAMNDHPTNRELLTQYFYHWHMHAEVVDNPRECLALLYEHARSGTPYDLAILDMEMPKMDGFGPPKAIMTEPLLQALGWSSSHL